MGAIASDCFPAPQPLVEGAMNDQPSPWVRTEPGVATLIGVNWIGLKTLYIKEVRRFFKVHMQTVWAPAINALLLMTIFIIAQARGDAQVMGVSFAAFIAPGLIMSAMLHNSFANGSFSLMVGKMQGTIVDYLMPPLSTGELIAALVGAAVTRAILVGLAVWLAMLLWPGMALPLTHPLAVLWFGLMGSTMLALLGVLTSIWADKFDQSAMVTNFVVLPLSLLSGTVYSVHQLSPLFQTISHANPFFYVISGFRYGFLGISDSPILVGAIGLAVVNGALWAACYALVRSGWKIKN